MEITYREERLSAKDYIAFLARTDLGQQYPKERFVPRITRLLKNASVSITARDGGTLVGVCLGLTDFAYWLMITDLGVDRNYTHMGIGRMLLQKAHTLSGGEKDILMMLYANDKAIPFYQKCGFSEAEDTLEYNKIDWTPFTVNGNEEE